jgi:DNA-directed RNA polymerase subunit F
MSNNLLQPDSDALHQSAIDVITHVGNVMSEGCGILREHDRLLAENQGGNRLGAEIKAIEEDIRHVNEKLERVKRKELTMTIVAPTSAGKSTILNAIAGQDLLPSRNDATTVLPTEIVFSREVTRPKLILDKALMTLLREVWGQLHQIFQRIGLEEAVKQATKNDFPRENVIREILNSSSVSSQSEVEESNSIQAELIRINDLLRLCGIFGIATDFLSSLSEIPRIEVPFPRQLSSLKDSGLGTLALVDTPGPSEDKSLNLVNVVKDRLIASSLVLVVVDYTKIGQTDPAKVKKLVDEIAAIKGRDRIYIIVNKIDDRDPNNPEDLTAKQILSLVKTKYEIDDPQNRVFEMSAIKGFLATNFQREKEIYQPTELRKRKSFEALGQKYYSNYWKTKKTTATIEEMQEVADEFLKDSGFVRFINKAIAPLVTDAAPSMITIKGALNDISQIFTFFLSCLSKQKGILERDIQRLGIEINQLEIDLQEVIIVDKDDKWKEQVVKIYLEYMDKFRSEQYRIFERQLSDKIDRGLNSLDGRVLARLERFLWMEETLKLNLEGIRDTWKFIGEALVEKCITENLLQPSFPLGERFKTITYELTNLWNFFVFSYHENIFIKAQIKIGKKFQFYFTPDYTKILLIVDSLDVKIIADRDETAVYNYGMSGYVSLEHKLPRLNPELNLITEWLLAQLTLKINGQRLDSNEVYQNILEISENLKIRLDKAINKSVDALVEECREWEELSLDPVQNKKYRMSNFIMRYSIQDDGSKYRKISKKKLKNVFDFIVTLSINNSASGYSYEFLGGIIRDQISRKLGSIDDYYCESFKKEKNRFLTEYKESLQYSILELKETVNKYSLIKNKCIRLSEIGTDLQLSIKHQQEYFKQY